MGVYIVIFVVLMIPVGVMHFLGSDIRRGCGRGCATCGNREFCHRGKKTEKHKEK